MTTNDIFISDLVLDVLIVYWCAFRFHKEVGIHSCLFSRFDDKISLHLSTLRLISQLLKMLVISVIYSVSLIDSSNFGNTWVNFIFHHISNMAEKTWLNIYDLHCISSSSFTWEGKQ